MDTPWRIVIHQSRYGGVYEGGRWFAIFCGDDFPYESIGDDVECAVFWASEEAEMHGVGNSPDKALESLFKNNGRAAAAYERIYGNLASFDGRRDSWGSKLKRFVARFSTRAYR